MTIKFDLEKAKAGEPIEFKEAYGWVEIPFIGAWTNPDYVVCEVPWSDKPECVEISKLRMAKKKEIVRYRVGAYRDERGLQPIIASNEYWAEIFSKNDEFDQWITDWQEYEIGANDENAL